MLDAVGRLYQRSRRPIIMLTTTLGGGYLAVSYLQSKLNQIQDSLTREKACSENLRRRFEQNQEDCAFTVLALIPTFGKQLIQSMNVERLVDVLSQTKSRPKPIPTDTPDSQNVMSVDPEPSAIDSQQFQQVNQDAQQNHPSDNQGNASSEPSNPVEIPSNIGQPNGLIDHPPASTSLESASGIEGSSQILVRPDGSVIQKRSEIWIEMMIVSFSRLFACLYGVTFLTLQTHIQLGLLGRDSYLGSIISIEKLDDDAETVKDRLSILAERGSLDVLTERRYLTFSWWYLHKGWIILSQRIRSAVVDVLSSRSLKDAISLPALQEIFDLIRMKVEFESDGTEFSFAPILLPTTSTDEIETLESGGIPVEDCEVDKRLRSLLDETQDFIESPDFRLVLSSAMSRVVDLCTSNLARKASLVHPTSQPTTSSILSRFTELATDHQDAQQNIPVVRIVEILPILSKESLDILNLLPNQYVETLSSTSELKEFSSVIFTSFDETLARTNM